MLAQINTIQLDSKYNNLERKFKNSINIFIKKLKKILKIGKNNIIFLKVMIN